MPSFKKIAVISPASPSVTYDKSSIKCFLESIGYTPIYGKHAFEIDRFMAGSDVHRADDILWAFTNPEIDAILCMRGGYGSGRVLDKLDYNTIIKHKKPLFGLSDITALQLALWHKCHLTSFTGLQASFMDKPLTTSMVETFKACLNHELMTFENLTPVTKGVATGTLIGGTLSLLVSLMGTPYMPDLTGAILVIEEVGEQPYQIDRMLNHLRLAGVFDKVAGIVLASFYKCVSKDVLDGPIDDVLSEQFGTLKIPVVQDFMYGHGANEIVFPIGANATLNADLGVLEINEY